jgi:DNA-binding CsgD family transcriptional regulator
MNGKPGDEDADKLILAQLREWLCLSLREQTEMTAKYEDGTALLVIRQVDGSLALTTLAGVDKKYRIGSQRPAEILLVDPKVSRAHAQIEGGDGNWLLRDRGSRNGTYVDDGPVERNEEVKLSHGSRLRFASTRGAIYAPTGFHSDTPYGGRGEIKPQRSLHQLSRRQKQVLVELCRPRIVYGKDLAENREIAKALSIKVGTVKAHIREVATAWDIDARQGVKRELIAEAAIEAGINELL